MGSPHFRTMPPYEFVIPESMAGELKVDHKCNLEAGVPSWNPCHFPNVAGSIHSLARISGPYKRTPGGTV